MKLSHEILGKTTVALLSQRAKDSVLQIGTDSFTRAQLAKLACFNFNAAATLSAIIREEFAVKNTLDLYTHIPPAALCLPRLGVIALATLGAAFESKLHKTLEDYYQLHAGDGESFVTFSTSKHQQHLRDAALRKADRSARRKQSRSAPASHRKDLSLHA